ncbi:hypothetical protein MTO96_034009 [Rhipicephalus appendiculatus]
MYHACLNFVASYEPETPYLIQWLVSLDLDLLNETRLANVNPVKMMVRGSLDLGVQAVIAIFFSAKYFNNNKRVMQLDYVEDKFFWKFFQRNINDYTQFMLIYGAKPPHDKVLAAKIKEYDDELHFIASNTDNNEQKYKSIEINNLGSLTEPYVTSDDWGAYISNYTNGTYTASDFIYQREHALQILVKLFKSMGEAGLRYLVAWKFYSHLLQFTESYMFLRGLPASVACYDHIRNVMGLAVVSPFLQSEVPKGMVQEAKDMVQEIRNSYQKALISSTWLSDDFRQAALKKMVNMVSYVGSPGRRLEPDYVEALYNDCPRNYARI